MKKLVKILIIAVVIIFVLSLAKDIIIKISVEKGVEFVTGLKLNIGSFNVGILRPITAIKNLRLFNPAGFPDKTMIDMPEIYVRYDLPAIIGGKIHLPEVRLVLREFVVVKNSKGELNLNALKSAQAQKKGKTPEQKTTGKAPKIKIDKLALSIGKVIYKDYSKGGTPDVKEFNINLNEVYTNVDNPYTLANLIVVKALIGTPIAALANFDLKGLQGSVGDAMAGAQKTASTAADKAGKTATQAADKAGKTATQATDKVKGLLKNLFGSGK
ncbi:MAG: AsmA family protein [Candidatus Omnitrophica bacterium]|jgi:hypothetical protein|nr:AsmA family protein [Candidatus Omnitrophota bacterium]